MSNICMLTGRTTTFGNHVSHSNHKTRRKFRPNVHKHRVWITNESRWVTLTLSTRAIKTINKNGIDSVLPQIRARGYKV